MKNEHLISQDDKSIVFLRAITKIALEDKNKKKVIVAVLNNNNEIELGVYSSLQTALDIEKHLSMWIDSITTSKDAPTSFKFPSEDAAKIKE